MRATLALLVLASAGASAYLATPSHRRQDFQPHSLRRAACSRCCAAEGGDQLSESDSVRLTQARLTEMERRALLKRKPRFLSFVQARDWASAMWFENEADWRRMIFNGELRNPYIPSEPEVVYAAEWQGWDDFLNGGSRSS